MFWLDHTWLEQKTENQQKEIDALQKGLENWRRLYWELHSAQIRDLGYDSDGYMTDDGYYGTDEDDI